MTVPKHINLIKMSFTIKNRKETDLCFKQLFR